jgi:quercetin dioxygenase-like cupin family protein
MQGEVQGREADHEQDASVCVDAALATVGLITGGVLPLAAQVAPPPIATEFLTGRAVFTDDIDLKIKIKREGDRTEVVNVEDPSRTLVARFTVQPGAQFPWHSHPGPVVVNVVEGSLVFVEADCGEHEYPAGTAFVDPGHGHVHSAFNPLVEGETVFVATFFEASEAGPLLIPTEPPECVV